MTLSFSFASYPNSSDRQYEGMSPKDEKIAKMKEELAAKRSDLKEIYLQYAEAYREENKKYEEARSIFEMQKAELNKLNKGDNNYDKKYDEFKNAKKAYMDERSERDLKLSLMQFRSDDYIKASRLTILDLV